jgi:hypothetical protein
MLSVAVMVDRNGTLNTASLDMSSGLGWQGPDTVGFANLIPGSTVTVLQASPSVYVALVVDRDGVLNIFSFNAAEGKGWQGPDTVGNASLVPGSPVTVFQQGSSIYTALTVDRNGVLNIASLDVSSGEGWQGLDTVGSASLEPGSAVTVCRDGSSTFTALMVDRSGVLNIATLDTSSTVGWNGPDTVGHGTLVPGSRVSVATQ